MDSDVPAGLSAHRVADPTTGRSLTDLPGARLWVTARLDALLDNDLALHDWEIAVRVSEPGMSIGD